VRWAGLYVLLYSSFITIAAVRTYTLTRGVIPSGVISPESIILSLADGGGGIDALALSEEEMLQIGRVRILPYMLIP
jgi:hypothetical protein